ncbi:MAG: Glu/Leu/Phe/Val dehydrogenase [Trueperaceae bacterium]|nr:MAG: Glu/Leu/Phe/Val dehydrogenase [Trueperaceae bacterium]
MDLEIRGIGDHLGPEKILLLRQPQVGLEAIVVVDNVAAGPAIGGVRIAPDVTVLEVFRLARAMTLKNALAGLPHGGAKSGILADAKMEIGDKEVLLRTFAKMIRHLEEYIPGPDMGTDEACMAWIKDEMGRAAGLPAVMGGIPLDEVGATGLGIAVAAEVAAPAAGLTLEGSRFVLQGFGAVGRHVARLLAERGVSLVAVADSRGALFAPAGLDVEALIDHKLSGASVGRFSGGRALDPDELVGVDCEIWIPAARPDVLRADNVEKLKARLVVQAANIPATAAAEIWMYEHSILNVPDFLANAGGVICASLEVRGGTWREAKEVIREKIRANTIEVLERSKKGARRPREVGVEMAQERVEEAMALRGRPVVRALNSDSVYLPL